MHRRRVRRKSVALVVILVSAATAVSAVWTNAFGAGDRFEGLRQRIELAVDPPPDRPTRPTIAVTMRPEPATPQPATPAPATPGPADVGAAKPPATPPPSPEPTPTRPARTPVDVDILPDSQAVFASQLTKDWCAVAGTQMVLAILGLADTSDEFQREIASRIDEWESWQDSHNGGWGPAAIALAVETYGAPAYEIRAYQTRDDALRDSAEALTETGAPVVLLTWRGAHTWVMTGYRADADPALFPDATISGAYILDPWYPRVSSIWGPSDPPGAFQNDAEMRRNYLRWERPEGRYPDRDGMFIALVPTRGLPPAN